MNTAISKTAVAGVLALNLASCATSPSGSKAPVVEAGMPTTRTNTMEPAVPADESPTVPPEPATTSRYAPQQLEVPTPLPGPVTEPRPTGSAVLALLQTAEMQQADGQLAAAAASLERALRIEPQNPWTWYRLAAVRLEQDRLDQAEQLARRCDALAGSDAQVRAHAWRLIAAVRERRGDTDGARAARHQANALEP